MNLTKQEAIENHRKMWNWIADETFKRRLAVSKVNYFEENKTEENLIPHLDCYCCEYSCRYDCDGEEELNCENCLFTWGTEKDRNSFFCEGERALYHEWKRALMRGDYDCAACLARQIAELPEKEDSQNA